LTQALPTDDDMHLEMRYLTVRSAKPYGADGRPAVLAWTDRAELVSGRPFLDGHDLYSAQSIALTVLSLCAPHGCNGRLVEIVTVLKTAYISIAANAAAASAVEVALLASASQQHRRMVETFPS
jgi:hypothetical protein